MTYHTLSELTQSLRSVIAKTYSKAYWIKAEVAKLNHYPKSGHCYPNLVEKHGGKVLAEMRGTLWRDNYHRLDRRFREVVKQPLEEGLVILFKGKVRFHPIYGLSIDIIEIDPSFSLGELAKEKQETIEKLKKEGIFERNKQIPFPVLPQRIAVISVDTSKGYQDFLKIIDHNSWGYRFFHMLFPAVLQGEKAITTIQEQLEKIRKVVHHFDVVAIIRGGGGDVGLSCYDSYELSREVAGFPIPVITGIGHSTNETVTEMVANVNPITPTDMAYHLLQHFHNYSIRIQEATRGVMEQTQRRMTSEKQRLQTDVSGFKSNVQTLLWRNRQRVMDLSAGLKYKPLERVNNEKEMIRSQSRMLVQYTNNLVKTQRKRLEHDLGRLKLLEPEQILKKGFSITYHNGRSLRDISDIEEGDEVTTKVATGAFNSRVSDKKQD